MSYGSRLKIALDLAKKTRGELVAHLGVTDQAVSQVLNGTTRALTAENSARAAQLLDVNHFWLATGVGAPRPPQGWPFASFLPSDYELIPPAIRQEMEDRLLGAITRIKAGESNAPKAGTVKLLNRVMGDAIPDETVAKHIPPAPKSHKKATRHKAD